MSEVNTTTATATLNPAQAGLPNATGAPEATPAAEVPAAGAATATEAPATAAPATQAQLPAADPDEAGSFTYDKTGDVALDMALGFVGRLGFGPEHPAIKAAQSGDFSILSAELAAKGDKALGWQEHIALAKGSQERAAATAKANAEAVTSTATKMCSDIGADWDAVRQWASANATDAEKAYVNSSLSQGGIAAKAALQFVVGAYARSAQAVLTPGKAASDNRGGPAAAAGAGALSAREYSTAVEALSRKHGGRDVSNLPEYKALQSARMAGRRAGK